MTEQEYIGLSESITPLLGKMLEGIIRRREPESIDEFKAVYPQLMGLIDGFIVKYCEGLRDEMDILDMVVSLLKFGMDMNDLKEAL